ncbi:MAG: hypothetical protein MUC94_02685 [bacterium]|jgi:membrane-bound serine protease (ClpP class)|nr:hypothetical protein [bacterium]
MTFDLLIGGLIIIGFILILIEIFLVPGFNIFGVFGFIMVVLGIILAYSRLDFRVANFILVASIIASLVLVRVIVKSKTWRRMILEEKQEKIHGFHASTDQLQNLIGKTGIAYTPLRPAGIAVIDDQKVDVMTEGGFIEKDHAIQVILVEGNRVVVKEINV